MSLNKQYILDLLWHCIALWVGQRTSFAMTNEIQYNYIDQIDR